MHPVSCRFQAAVFLFVPVRRVPFADPWIEEAAAVEPAVGAAAVAAPGDFLAALALLADSVAAADLRDWADSAEASADLAGSVAAFADSAGFAEVLAGSGPVAGAPNAEVVASFAALPGQVAVLPSGSRQVDLPAFAPVAGYH